jgi:hypothetical protein
MQARPKDINELRDRLGDVFAKVEGDPKAAMQGYTLANIAGKMLLCEKLKIEHAAIIHEEPDVSFMGKTTRKTLTGSTLKQLKE